MVRSHYIAHETGIPYHYEFYCGTVMPVENSRGVKGNAILKSLED
jgi:hypothetical protein